MPKIHPVLKSILSKHAPETLKTPRMEDFADLPGKPALKSYQGALKRYKKKGHWAQPDESNPVEKTIYSLFDR